MEERKEEQVDPNQPEISEDNLFCGEKPVKKEEKKTNLAIQAKAKYIHETINIEYSACLTFAEKYPALTREELLEKYLETL